MSTWTHAQLSMSTGTQLIKRSMPNLRVQSCQLSMSTRKQAKLKMSTRTQALNQSMPNPWARSSHLQCHHGHKPSYKCQQGHKLSIDQ